MYVTCRTYMLEDCRNGEMVEVSQEENLLSEL